MKSRRSFGCAAATTRPVFPGGLLFLCPLAKAIGAIGSWWVKFSPLALKALVSGRLSGLCCFWRLVLITLPTLVYIVCTAQQLPTVPGPHPRRTLGGPFARNDMLTRRYALKVR